MSDNKYFVDINNLNRFWSNAKEYIDNNISKTKVKTITSPYIILDKQLQPNIVYEIIGIKRQINIRIKDPGKNYIFRFVSGYEPTILTLFGDIHWENNKYPEIKKYTKYTINISNGIAYIMSTETSLEKQYLTFEVLSESSFSFSKNNIDYSLDGGSTWTTLTAGSSTPTIATGSKIMWRGSIQTASSTDGIGSFSSTGSYSVEGNIMSLLYGDDFVDKTSMFSSYMFRRLFYNSANLLHAYKLILPTINLLHNSGRNCYDSMFYNCSSLITAPELPATTLAYSCYDSMFYGCISLPNPPELPATTLTNNCYECMFKGCSSLITAPELPATNLADYCYSEMFYGCKLLISAPELPATNLADYCYYNMFYNCELLISAPELPATTLTNKCYSYMFYNCQSLIISPELPATNLASQCYNAIFSHCTKLTTAPELPATNLVYGCYDNMFENCTSLTTAPELPATNLDSRCYYSMFENCTSLTTAPELPATNLANECYSNMFSGCTSLTTAPTLPATTLQRYCYQYMFQNCSKLNNITMIATDISADYCLYEWVKGVASTGTFIKDFSMTSLPTGVSGIPSGWTVKDNVTITKCNNLEITADDVSGRATTTTIYYRATCDVIVNTGQNAGQNTTAQIEGNTISAEFPQNTSTTNTVTRTITFEYMGVTATTTITQGVWEDKKYMVDLNNQWQASSKPNPDSNTYEGVYESFSNYNVNNSAAAMYIDISGYNTFKLYIRSYAESSFDYVMVSQLDKTIAYNTSYSDTTLVKAHTRGSQNSDTSISGYKLVEFTNIDGEDHRIMIIYRKDSSAHNNDDRGYVLIPKNQQ